MGLLYIPHRGEIWTFTLFVCMYVFVYNTFTLFIKLFLMIELQSVIIY